jgi:hypothetical protein
MPVDFVVATTSNRVAKGIDTRGVGGQVIIPPSIHPNGNVYKWLDGHSPLDIEPAIPPTWLTEKLKAAMRVAMPVIGENLEPGERNNSMFHNALQLARTNANMEFVIHSMRLWCDQNGASDIKDDEIQATVISAYKLARSEANKAYF